MTTFNTLVNSALQGMNEQIIDGLVQNGIDHDRAVQFVVEFDEYDFIADATENPVELF